MDTTVIVEPCNPEEADRRFENWKASNAEIVKKLRPQDVIVDWIRGGTGETLKRYRIPLAAGMRDEAT